jgi:DNA-binding response OmpR family regulator
MNTDSNNYARILVCDDEAHIRQIIGRKLLSVGFHVAEARNGQEALAMLDSGPQAGFRPDLVITDLQMPMITGLELCQVLRRRSDTAHVPCLMLTARGYILSPDDLANTNIRLVISKPFGVRQLLDRVVAILLEKSSALIPSTLKNPGDAASGPRAA